MSKEEEGNALLQLQVQQIKSPTVSLKPWTLEASTSWNKARSEPERTPQSPQQRDLPRNIRGLSEKADWLVLPVWRGQQRTQVDILLTATLYIFFFFCIVLIFFFISPLILIFNLLCPFLKNILFLNKLYFLFLQYSIVTLHSLHVFYFVFLLV